MAWQACGHLWTRSYYERTTDAGDNSTSRGIVRKNRDVEAVAPQGYKNNESFGSKLLLNLLLGVVQRQRAYRNELMCSVRLQASVSLDFDRPCYT